MRKRQFQSTLFAGVTRHADSLLEGVSLTAPGVGLWRDAPPPGSLLRPGMSLGNLEVLGVLHRIEIPRGANGVVRPYGDSRSLAREPVEYGDVLVTLDPYQAAGDDTTSDETSAATTSDLLFRSPSSGRFYGRPAPDKPPFVSVGDVIETGHTVALLEVMKTFNRIQYGGGSLPSPARVSKIVPADQSDLGAGDPILEVEAAD